MLNFSAKIVNIWEVSPNFRLNFTQMYSILLHLRELQWNQYITPKLINLIYIGDYGDFYYFCKLI